ncbi:MAG TPA: SRPBCC family protein [Lutibacter sp.]
MGFYQRKQTQKIKGTINDVWNFISSPANLKKITPDYMGFDIISSDLPEKMYPGMIICYKVSPLLGIKMNWLTEITQVDEKNYFIDEQRIGPYKIWHHQHRIEPIKGGVLMTDIVTYQPPMGFLGSIANTLVIKNKLNEIFDYRRNVLNEVFGELK